jgi:hypothetical protein
MSSLPAGALKRIHVNQHNLRQRVSGNGSAPCYTIKHKGQTIWAHEVLIDGPSKLVERIDSPLGCGARLWIETTSEVQLT